MLHSTHFAVRVLTGEIISTDHKIIIDEHAIIHSCHKIISSNHKVIIIDDQIITLIIWFFQIFFSLITRWCGDDERK